MESNLSQLNASLLLGRGLGDKLGSHKERKSVKTLSRHCSASVSLEEAVVSPYWPLHIPHMPCACLPLSCFWLLSSSRCQGLCRALVALEHSDFPPAGMLCLPGWLWWSSGSWLWKSWSLGTSLDKVWGTRRWLSLNPECLDNPWVRPPACGCRWDLIWWSITAHPSLASWRPVPAEFCSTSMTASKIP